ncbi:MAG: hypothetical protein ACK2UI_09350, partial [Anaerolineae bacterium]
MKTRKCLLALVCCIGLLGLPVPVLSQATVPPPDVASYDITATYDPQTHTLTGQQTAVYHNRTDTAIPNMVFHLYLNAFSSAKTLWMRESDVSMRGYSFNPHAPGWMRIDQISLADGTALSVKAAGYTAASFRTRVDSLRPHWVRFEQSDGESVTEIYSSPSATWAPGADGRPRMID